MPAGARCGGRSTRPTPPPGLTTDYTTAYSADNLGNGRLRIVGTYSVTGAPNELGFLFNGLVNDVGAAASYEPIPRPRPSATWNIPHSTSGGLVVGNYDSSTANDLPAGGGLAYVYGAVNRRYLVPSLVYPGSASNTAYGIWDNGDGSYTIAGGFSLLPVNNAADRLQPIGMASLIDYHRASGTFSNWRAYSYQSPDQATVATHFMGISSVEKGVYTLSGSGFVSGQIVSSGLATVVRQTDGSFGDMAWVELAPPASVTGVSGLPSANSVYGNAVVGIVLGEGGTSASYQAKVNVGFQPSNVISGNRGQGVAIAGGADNVVAMNLIGTNVSGQAAVPNRGNGILVASRAAGNLIGGHATGGNSPTAGVFVGRRRAT